MTAPNPAGLTEPVAGLLMSAVSSPQPLPAALSAMMASSTSQLLRKAWAARSDIPLDEVRGRLEVEDSPDVLAALVSHPGLTASDVTPLLSRLRSSALAAALAHPALPDDQVAAGLAGLAGDAAALRGFWRRAGRDRLERDDVAAAFITAWPGWCFAEMAFFMGPPTADTAVLGRLASLGASEATEAAELIVRLPVRPAVRAGLVAAVKVWEANPPRPVGGFGPALAAARVWLDPAGDHDDQVLRSLAYSGRDARLLQVLAARASSSSSTELAETLLANACLFNPDHPEALAALGPALLERLAPLPEETYCEQIVTLAAAMALHPQRWESAGPGILHRWMDRLSSEECRASTAAATAAVIPAHLGWPLLKQVTAGTDLLWAAPAGPALAYAAREFNVWDLVSAELGGDEAALEVLVHLAGSFGGSLRQLVDTAATLATPTAAG